MNTMEITKIVAGLCASLLVFLGVRFFVADPLYFGGGHGEGEAAYVLEVADSDAPAEEEEEVDYAALIAQADVANGEKEFGKCKACHKLEDGANGVGPTLFHVVGRDMGGVEGYNYSSAMAEAEGEWTAEKIAHFLHKPKEFVPGTKMSFAGFRDYQDGADVAAYLAAQN
ncbi:cytochrome c family protein [Oceanicella sp. SM1341]|uniref:c-type cytochrome n=1 Tax=Oceanicella sp. SM1341 TaxID=1548889 RepID=UPI00351672B9